MPGANLTDGHTTGPGTFSGLFVQNVQDAILQDFVVDGVPVGDMPKLFTCQRLTLRRGLIKNIRAGSIAEGKDHVEGIHIAGCQGVLIEDVEFVNNDVFHVFLTAWADGDDPGAAADPISDVVLTRVRLGRLGVNGTGRDALGRVSSTTVKARDGEVPNGYGGLYDASGRVKVPGFKMTDCQVRGNVTTPGVQTNYAALGLLLPAGAVVTYAGQPGVLVVPDGVPWPAFPGGQPPPPPPPPDDPPAATLEQRVIAVETALGDLADAYIELAARVGTVDTRLTGGLVEQAQAIANLLTALNTAQDTAETTTDTLRLIASRVDGLAQRLTVTPEEIAAARTVVAKYRKGSPNIADNDDRVWAVLERIAGLA